MARRDESILDLFVELPWWASVIASVVSYLGLRYVLPAVPADSPIWGMIVQIGSALAPLIAAAFMVTAVVSALRSATAGIRANKEHGARVAQGVSVVSSVRKPVALTRSCKAGSRRRRWKFWGCSSFPKCRYTQDYAR